jgi:cobalt-zinc-cadmium efflux system membrane fusion protein
MKWIRSFANKVLPVLTAGLLIGGIVLAGVFWLRRHPAALAAEQKPALPNIQLISTKPDVIRLPADYEKVLQIETAEVEDAPSPLPLRLPGTLLFDANKLSRIHTLFTGQVVWIADADGTIKRQLTYGDAVRKGQVLLRIWSKDVGEKKSELVDAISRQEVDRALLDRYLKLERGIIAERAVDDARRAYEADVIAVARAERTLRSWGLTQAEIQEVRDEARRVRKGQTSPQREDENTWNKSWAEIAIRAPQDGVIVEMNFTLGDVIDPTVVLFQIADTQRVQVLANAYEEDFPLLQQMIERRQQAFEACWAVRPFAQLREDLDKVPWTIELQTAGGSQALPGQIEKTGQIIDPTQHTGSVIGWLHNDARLQLKAGQFIRAVVQLLPDDRLVAIPASALSDEGDSARVLVATSSDNREFTPRPVAVVTRGRTVVLVRKIPTPEEQERGAQPLSRGERVVTHGNLELLAELATLKASPGASKHPEP